MEILLSLPGLGWEGVSGFRDAIGAGIEWLWQGRARGCGGKRTKSRSSL